MYRIIFKKKATKQISKLRAKDRVRVGEAIDELRTNPFIGNKLDGDLDGFYAIRVWPYRIVYSIEKEIITVNILSVGHRKDVYLKI